VLEVTRRQAEQVLEHLQAQHGIDAVAGVQDQVLAHPGHRRTEHHEHGQPDADDDQGIEGVMDDHLVDDHLREQGRGQRHELDGEGSQKDVAEYLAVLQQLGEEPAEAELRAGGGLRIRIRQRFGLGRCLQDPARVARLEFGKGQDSVTGSALLEEGHAVFFEAQYKGEPPNRCLRVQGGKTLTVDTGVDLLRLAYNRSEQNHERRRDFFQPRDRQRLPGRAQAQQFGRARDRLEIVRRRKLAGYQPFVKRNAKVLAERGQHPYQCLPVERTTLRPPPLLLQPSRGKRLHRLRTHWQIPCSGFMLGFVFMTSACACASFAYVVFLRHPGKLSNLTNERFGAMENFPRCRSIAQTRRNTLNRNGCCGASPLQQPKFVGGRRTRST